MSGAMFLLVLAVLALGAGAAYLHHLREKERSAALAEYCRSRGWRYSVEDPYGLVHRWDGSPFGEGRSRRVRNVITFSVDGRAVVAFDYSFVVDRDKHSRTYRYAVVAMGLPCALPGLHVGPEGIFTRLGTFVGVEDIELESEDFNRQFHVRCPEPRFAHDVLTPRTMQALMAMGPVELRFAGTDALCYGLGRISPDEVHVRVHALRTVLDGIPSFVWRDRGVAS